MSDKRLTVNQLYKLLGKMIDEGYGRRYVCVEKRSFHSDLEQDGGTILGAYDCRICCVPLMDGDGFTELRADGTEKQRMTAVLFGNCDGGYWE